jgi:hypothetical protein
MGGIELKKIIAPLIVVLVILAINAGYFTTVITIPIPVIVKIMFGIGSVSVSGALIYVLIERIKEIRKEDEDDLGKY